MRKTYFGGGALVVLMLCAEGGAALAQTTPAPALEEIVVTARRRAETLENVPATVQALSAETLVTRGVHTENDLQAVVPGLVVRTNNSQFQLNYVIRGESMEPYSGSVPGVQPYIDEVPVNASAPTLLYDLENVQVLKGPQGTLFGRNSTGGAVLYRTGQPKDTLGGYISVQYGNYDRLITEGAVNAPLIGDKVVLRLAGTYTSGGAFVTNVYDGSKAGDSNIRSGRATLRLRPTDNLTNTTMVQYANIHGSNTGHVPFHVEPCGGVGTQTTCWATAGNAFFQQFINSAPGTYFPNWPNGFVYPGGLPTIIPFLNSLGHYKVDVNAPEPYYAQSTLVVNTTTWDLSSDLTLKNTFGFGRSHRAFAYDNDATPYPFLQAGGGHPGGSNLEDRVDKQYSDEFQIQGKAFDNRLTYIAGAMFFQSVTTNNSPITGFSYVPALNLPVTFALRYKARATDTSYAVFTQGTYALTDKLNVTAGIRETWDRLTSLQLPGSTFFGGPAQYAWNHHPSWTVTLDYHLKPELMVYATTRGSWRVGGYNPFVAAVGQKQTAATGGNYFPPETIHDVEVGAKFSGQVAGMPVRANADVFKAWIMNIQKTAYTVIAGRITSTTVTVPAGEVSGIEADGEIAPTSWLRLGGNVSYNYGEYTDRVAVLYGQTAVFGPFSDMPRYSGTVYANVTVPLSGDIGTLRYHIDAFAQSSFHVSNLGNTFNPGDKLPGYALANTRLDWVDLMGKKGLTGSLFVQNLTNTYYFTGGSGAINLYSLNHATFGMPRTYGFVVRYDF